jgi:hypothetical protein
MQYKGIEFAVEKTRHRNLWRWVFWIGDEARSGRVRTHFEVLAVRRIEALIDRELRKRGERMLWSNDRIATKNEARCA